MSPLIHFIAYFLLLAGYSVFAVHYAVEAFHQAFPQHQARDETPAPSEPEPPVISIRHHVD
ncbi:hypothetical protein [Roseococcus pinisoli]|uniref:Uncharacterized protein n=1 Tax=Roseococcus pinisoli TaxID=2835040 RepID=A0ABS5QF05_9PROT|nr:hypothetical protein [Roseococcus pinisoli]MBS7812280.1 hypothetical protein [Roseococcus pinisoli]